MVLKYIVEGEVEKLEGEAGLVEVDNNEGEIGSTED